MLGELTTLEIRILASLTEPQTSTELFANLGIGYPYGIKVIRKMKHKKLIDHQQRGTYTYYFTIRTSETEDIFAARANSTGKSKYMFPFRGEWTDLFAVGRTLQNKQKPFPLLELSNRILKNLRYNSYRKEASMPTQNPYATEMRMALERRLAIARAEITFAEEMLKAPIWNDSPHTYKLISDEGVNLETGRINSDQLGKGIL